MDTEESNAANPEDSQTPPQEKASPASSSLLPSLSPEPGGIWCEKWKVDADFPGAREDSAWLVTEVESGRRARMAAARTTDPKDMEAWERLALCESPRLVSPLDARVSGDRRFEVYSVPDGPTLASKLPKLGPVPMATLKNWIKDVADALESLHNCSLVHCHLSPEHLFLVNEGGAQRLIVSGLEGLVCSDRSGMVSIEVDPFYAPPESAGLFQHECSEMLKAWDWWSLGRIVQELVLGRHIIEHMLDTQLTKTALEEKDFAEKLLMERAHGETKAGAVEAMPPMDKHVDLLLHGLLSRCRDARWGIDEVREWLLGGSPKQRYHLPRNELLFRWKNHAYTVPEMAEILQTSGNWEEAKKQVIDKDTPGTFAHFICNHPVLAPCAKKLDDALALFMASDLRSYAMPIKSEIVLSVALQKLSGGSLVWQGRKVDSANLRDMLLEDTSGTTLSCVQAFTVASVLMPLEKEDFQAYRTLNEGARLAAKAIQRATKSDWMKAGGVNGTSRIWRMSFESPTAWAEARQHLSAVFACSDQKEVQDIFENPHPDAEEALLLGWMLPSADRYGFVPNEVWAHRMQSSLTDRAKHLSEALFWHRMARTLQSGAFWFGNLLLILGAWVALGALIALAWPGPDYLPAAFLPLGLALCMRLSLRWIMPGFIEGHVRDARWGFFDGTGRCLREYSKATDKEVKPGELLQQLREINAKLASLTHIHPAPRLIPEPPHFLDLRLLAYSSWIFLIVPAVFALVELHRTPDIRWHVADAWTPEEEKHLEWLPPEPTVKMEFPFEAPSNPKSIKIISEDTATKLQAKAAQRKGAYYAQDYRPEDIGALILVRIPDNAHYAFMLYDPKSGKVVSNRIIHLRSILPRRVFVRVDKYTVWVPNY
ncbi:MAG: hypothetical protein WC378_13105 [Opitutaceae bacterium]|jgi:serine/threonine protein kinase